MFDPALYYDVPYKQFGRDFSGMDCYGFVRDVLKGGGKKIPEYPFLFTGDQRKVFLEMVSTKEKTKPGNYDIIDLESSTVTEHIGVYLNGLVWQMVETGVFSVPWKRVAGRVKGIYEVQS